MYGSDDTSGSLAPCRIGRRPGGRAGDTPGMMNPGEWAHPLDVPAVPRIGTSVTYPHSRRRLQDHLSYGADVMLGLTLPVQGCWSGWVDRLAASAG